ncbi:UNVERIFIED_CONTAM: hypothetical protein Sradi_2664200 [Sesamum radiatum]|uniref:Retrotransposon gag domain-containing protein n=1 Tax=Sesamum radiatum TaxID=300843 RepID=A0AAW2S5U3_SESRA
MDTQGKAVKPVPNSPYQSLQAQVSRVLVLLRGTCRKALKESSQMSPLADYGDKCYNYREQLADLTRAVEGLMKHVQEQDAQIARLINKADNIDASHVMEKQVEAHDEVGMPIKQHYAEKDKSAKEFFKISSDGLIPVDQLKEFIEGTIRSKLEGSSRTYGDHLVKQFVRSLKGNAFDWYTDLEAGSINGWEHLEQEFLNRFL